MKPNWFLISANNGKLISSRGSSRRYPIGSRSRNAPRRATYGNRSIAQLWRQMIERTAVAGPIARRLGLLTPKLGHNLRGDGFKRRIRQIKRSTVGDDPN